MAALCSPSPLASLPSRRLAVTTNPLVLDTSVQRPLTVRAFRHARFHSTTVQPVRCCTSSDLSCEETKSSSARVFIKGLSRATKEGSLIKAFSQFGKVNRVKIIREKKSGESLGFAYIWFTSEESAKLATKEMDGKFFGGKFIVVTIAKPESPTSQVRPTPYKF